jgi:hypothetical protein
VLLQFVFLRTDDFLMLCHKKAARKSIFKRGLKEQSRKAHSGTTSGCAAGATPTTQIQQISGAFSAGKSGRSTVRQEN